MTAAELRYYEDAASSGDDMNRRTAETWGHPMRSEQRKAVRVQLEHKYPVNLVAVDGTWRRGCVLLDVSATGAKLEVEGSADVLRAKEFFLLLSTTGLVFRRCELARVDASPTVLNMYMYRGRTTANVVMLSSRAPLMNA